MPRRCDIAIIGAGTAGLSALAAVRKQTDDYLLINDGAWGTMCARVGCMPSKALIEAANAYHRRHFMKTVGVDGTQSLSIDRSAVLQHARALRDDFVAGVVKGTRDDPRAIDGRARFVDPQTLNVNGERLEVGRTIIATGSRPIVPAAWQRLGDKVLTTDTLFEQLSLPPRMAVIGLGGVGAEMAQALARLGIEVHGFDAAARIAGLSDPAVNRALVEALRGEFTLQLDAQARLEDGGDGLRIDAGGEGLLVDRALVALGRKPNLDGLGLETLGIELDEHGMPSFDERTMQVGDLPVFIAGDVNARRPLLHEASDDGYIAGCNALRDQPECFERRPPLAIAFTDPNVAIVGRAHADLPAGQAVTGAVDFSNQGRARISGDNRGCLRVYAEKASGRLLGAELCAPHGEHLAHLLALAVQRKLSVQDLLRTPFYHPVVEEGLRSALRDAAGKLGGPKGPDLAACHRVGGEALD